MPAGYGGSYFERIVRDDTLLEYFLFIKHILPSQKNYTQNNGLNRTPTLFTDRFILIFSAYNFHKNYYLHIYANHIFCGMVNDINAMTETSSPIERFRDMPGGVRQKADGEMNTFCEQRPETVRSEVGATGAPVTARRYNRFCEDGHFAFTVKNRRTGRGFHREVKAKRGGITSADVLSAKLSGRTFFIPFRPP